MILMCGCIKSKLTSGCLCLLLADTAIAILCLCATWVWHTAEIFGGTCPQGPPVPTLMSSMLFRHSRVLGCSIWVNKNSTCNFKQPIFIVGSYYILPSEGRPSWVQTTVASLISQKSSQTVPQRLLKQISIRPSVEFCPPRSLISPSEQGSKI